MAATGLMKDYSTQHPDAQFVFETEGQSFKLWLILPSANGTKFSVSGTALYEALEANLLLLFDMAKNSLGDNYGLNV